MKPKMRFPIVLGLLQLTLQSAPSYADVVYATSSLWRSPLPSGVALTGAPSMGADFQTACTSFQNLITKYADLLALPDQAANLKPILDQARKQPLASQFPSASFQGKFKLDLSSDGNVLSASLKSQMAQVAVSAAASDVRPHFTQAPNAGYVSGQSYSAGTPRFTQDSLSQAISVTGLTPLPATLTFVVGDGAYLTVNSLDTACDFLNAKLSFQVAVPVTAQLSVDQQASLRTFYLAISNIGDSVTAKYRDPIKRAAALGYRLGDFYAQSFPGASPGASEDQVDDMIGGALDAYFVDGTLDLNALWSKSLNGEYILDVQANSSPVEVQLSLGANP